MLRKKNSKKPKGSNRKSQSPQKSSSRKYNKVPSTIRKVDVPMNVSPSPSATHNVLITSLLERLSRVSPFRRRTLVASSFSDRTPSLRSSSSESFDSLDTLANDSSGSGDNLKVCSGAAECLEEEVEKDLKLVEQAKKREMTTSQEIWNAITMLPGMIYCIYYILSSKWISQDIMSFTKDNLMHDQTTNTMQDGIEDGCINSSYFPHLSSLPPAPVALIAIGIILHSPCSMYYHFACAFWLTGKQRLNHWSRRLDQAMIHCGMGICWSYGTTASKNFVLYTMAFSLDSTFRLFQKTVRPKSNLIRMIVSFLAPTLPILLRGDIDSFSKLIIIYAFGGWLFSVYPFGGWSHGLFHVVLFLSIPILFRVAANLSSSQEQIEFAARCAILRDIPEVY